MPTSLVPSALSSDQRSLTITWNDGVTQTIPWRELRDRCPCATCREKRAEPPQLFTILKPQETLPLRATAMQPVGNYAYKIDFTDEHNSGIYTIDYLREIGDELQAGAKPAE